MPRLTYDTPVSELYHSAMPKGTPKADHKYIYREWKNGRWVYHYEDGTPVKELPRGMNYKTEAQVEIEQKATEAAKAEKMTKEKEKTARETKNMSKIDQAVDRGKKAMEKISILLGTRLVDIPKAIEYLRDDK